LYGKDIDDERPSATCGVSTTGGGREDTAGFAFRRNRSMQFNPQLVQVLKQVVTSLTLSQIISTLLSPSSVPPLYG
jgi:hypothetical protein